MGIFSGSQLGVLVLFLQTTGGAGRLWNFVPLISVLQRNWGSEKELNGDHPPADLGSLGFSSCFWIRQQLNATNTSTFAEVLLTLLFSFVFFLLFKVWKRLSVMSSECCLILFLLFFPDRVYLLLNDKKGLLGGAHSHSAKKHPTCKQCKIFKSLLSGLLFWGPSNWRKSNSVLNNHPGCGCQLEVLRGTVYKKPG